MRDTLNLQALKRSKLEKHHTIYKKANKIMAKGFETEELSDEQVMDIANRYPRLKVSIVMGGDIIVRSLNDTWIVKDEGRFISLYHKALILENGKTKEKYHIQDIFYDLDFVFASIISHDDFRLGIKSRTTDEIQEIVKESHLAVI
ncbi:hypothetical protein CN984_12675 [Bacillus cereus]|uniref:Uncharacterized protein n=1 Tax=Bacillus cereus TaxID=1396 RepID=A0A2A7FNP6_BACCE|nr:hypothetical protein [Bacillus cereus]PEA25886.1 hypothetical protein CON44_18280 [Bacillus cereus]PGO29272.1 hypothetical protein CN984_12675 [Bacillus cereus]